MKSRAIFCLLLGLALGALGAGSTTSPADHGLFDPHKNLMATPVASLIGMDALEPEGGVAKAMEFIYAPTPRDESVSKAYADNETSCMALWRKMRAKYDDKTMAKLNDAMRFADDAEMRTMKVTVDGDNAVVQGAKGWERWNMIRIGDHWMLNKPEQIAGLHTDAEVDNYVQSIEAAATMWAQTSQDFDAGKFATPDALAQALRERIAQVLGDE